MGNDNLFIKQADTVIDPSLIKAGLSLEEISYDPKLIDIFNKCDKNGNKVLDEKEISMFLDSVKDPAGDGFEGSTRASNVQRIFNEDGTYSIVRTDNENKKITDYYNQNGKKYMTTTLHPDGTLIEQMPDEKGELLSQKNIYTNNSRDEFLFRDDGTYVNDFYANDKIQTRTVYLKETQEVISQTVFDENGELKEFFNSSYPIRLLKEEINAQNILLADSYNARDIMNALNDYENIDNPNEKTITLADKIQNSNMTEAEKRQSIKHLGQSLIEFMKKKEIYSFGAQKEFQDAVSDVNFDIKKAAVILNSLSEYANSENKKPNGDVDGDFSQGKTGDCWFLSSLQALRSTSEGQNILNESVDIEEGSNNIIVTLKGVNKTYTITPEELKSSQSLATGDLDVRAIEIALQKYFKEFPQNGKDTIDGNSPALAFKILTGRNTISYNKMDSQTNVIIELLKEQMKQTDNKKVPDNVSIFNSITRQSQLAGQKGFDNKMLDEIQQMEGRSMTASTLNSLDEKYTKTSFIDILKGKPHLQENHAYTLKKVDKDYVYLINPHNTSEEVKIKREVFLECFGSIMIL